MARDYLDHDFLDLAKRTDRPEYKQANALVDIAESLRVLAQFVTKADQDV